MSALLVVNADDLGLTRGICDAVQIAHREGIVTSTSILAVGTAFDHAVAMLRRNPGLGVGAHLAIVGEDPPLLSAREIPTLVGRDGRFPLSYRTVVARGALGRIDRDDVRREFAAQLDRIAGAGLRLTHVDTHQHTHLWPAVAQVVVDLAATRGIEVVRLPASARRGPVGQGVNLLARRLRARLGPAHLHTTAYYAGLDEAGSLDRAALSAALRAGRARGAVTMEVNTHPGLPGDGELDRFDWGYHWGEELTMLIDRRVREDVAAHGFRLGTFADLVARDGAP